MRIEKMMRLCCWIGAALDFKAAILLAFPYAFPGLYGLFFSPYYGMSKDSLPTGRLAAVLSLTWALLLIWTSRKPIERRAVMLLSVCPLGIGLVGLRIMEITKYGPRYASVSMLSFLSAVIVLYAYSSFPRKLDRGARRSRG